MFLSRNIYKEMTVVLEYENIQLLELNSPKSKKTYCLHLLQSLSLCTKLALGTLIFII